MDSRFRGNDSLGYFIKLCCILLFLYVAIQSRINNLGHFLCIQSAIEKVIDPLTLVYRISYHLGIIDLKNGKTRAICYPVLELFDLA